MMRIMRSTFPVAAALALALVGCAPTDQARSGGDQADESTDASGDDAASPSSPAAADSAAALADSAAADEPAAAETPADETASAAAAESSAPPAGSPSAEGPPAATAAADPAAAAPDAQAPGAESPSPELSPPAASPGSTAAAEPAAADAAAEAAAEAPAADQTADADAPTGTGPVGEPTVAEATAEKAIPKKPAIDPIVANGRIFVDWQKPQAAILISGELDGYLEPCGCAGLENQMGGLMRRHTLIKELERQGWPLVRLDMGGLTKRLGPQTEIKYKYAVESLAELGYAAVGFGANELKLNVDAVAGALMNIDPAKNPAVSANVGVYGLQEAVDLGISKPYHIVDAGGKRIGVTSVLGAKHREELKNLADIAIVDPAEALAKVAPQIAAEKPDVQVLLVHGDPTEAAALSQRFPQFQIVATTGGAEEPPASPKQIPATGATLIQAGHKGMYVIVLGFYDDPQQPVRYQRVPLDARFADSPEMKAKLTAYQKELETMTLANLGLTGNPHPDGDFIGSEACAECHTAAWAEYEKTPHYHATDTLVKLDPPRHFDPECLSCHATGWNPQEYFPYTTGFFGLESTPEMKQQGCENCHGPAKAHVKVENEEVEATEAEREALRAALRLKIVDNEGNKEGQADGRVVRMCQECHDIDNSPDFDFQVYWPHVRHEGKE
jgi:hypothetical protein